MKDKGTTPASNYRGQTTSSLVRCWVILIEPAELVGHLPDPKESEVIMHAVDHDYKPALVISPAEFSTGVEAFFNGADLLVKTQAIRLSTVDADGWPRSSLLSIGDIVFRADEGFRFGVFEQSGTAANLARDGRVTFSIAHDGGIWEVRLRASAYDRAMADDSLAFFKAKIESVRLHAAPYAEVTSGITFSLHEPSTVLPRWQKQITALREIS